MSASSLSGGSIRILWDATTPAEVTISGPGTEVFTVNGGAITFPYTLSASTTFDTNNSGTYDVSVKHHGYEVAGTPDGTRTCELSFGQQVTFAPTPDGTPHDKVLAHLSATFATVNDAHAPRSHRYAVTPTMVAQANASGHGWVAASGNTATLTLDDTAYAPIGAQSIKFVTNGSGGASRVDKTGLSFNWTDQSPVVWVMVDDPTKLNGLSLYLGDNGFANYYLWQFAPKITNENEFKAGEFVKITLNWGDATTSGSPNRAALTSARFFAQDFSTGACTVHFSGLAAQVEPTRYPSGVVVFTFDDARITQWSKARPILDKYGFPATAYVIAERVDSDGGSSWMTTAQLQDLQNKSGWEIGAHAYSQTFHDQVGGFTACTDAQLADDFANLKRWAAERGLSLGMDHLAYPQGLHNAAVLAMTRRYYTSGRGTWGKSGTASTWPPADPYRLRTRILSSGAESTLASLQTAVDRTVANGGMLVITGHALGAVADSLTWVEADFASLVSYVSASGAAVRTIGAALRGD